MQLMQCNLGDLGPQAQNFVATTTSTIGTGTMTISGNYTDTSGGLSYNTSSTNAFHYITPHDFYFHHYYPNIICESYPVYIKEKTMDKGKQAFEILKSLMDKGLMKVDKVKDFVTAMDTILKAI